MFEIGQTLPRFLLLRQVPHARRLPPFAPNCPESVFTLCLPTSFRHSTPLFRRKTVASSFLSAARMASLNAFQAFSGTFELMTIRNFMCSPPLKNLLDYPYLENDSLYLVDSDILHQRLDWAMNRDLLQELALAETKK